MCLASNSPASLSTVDAIFAVYEASSWELWIFMWYTAFDGSSRGAVYIVFFYLFLFFFLVIFIQVKRNSTLSLAHDMTIDTRFVTYVTYETLD